MPDPDPSIRSIPGRRPSPPLLVFVSHQSPTALGVNSYSLHPPLKPLPALQQALHRSLSDPEHQEFTTAQHLTQHNKGQRRRNKKKQATESFVFIERGCP
eukprot:766165-Hanusia_phi.AAC.1